MTEIKRVHYKINGTESPVIHLECRSPEEQAKARQLAKAAYPGESAWHAKALADLETFGSKATWAEVYIRCGRCKREWDAWLAKNPVTEPLDEWIAKAKSVVMEKRWI